MKHFKIDPKSPLPKIRQIEQHIRNQIETGEMEPGLKLPCMLDLAEQTGASIGIIRQALRTLTLEEYLRTVPKIGVFVADTPPLKNIALLLPSIELEQMPRTVRAARSRLPENYSLIIEAPSRGYTGQIQLLKNIHPSHVSGIILLTPPTNDFTEKIKEAAPPGIPCIQTNTELDGLLIDSVTTDGFSMGKNTVEYLIKNGHKKIGLVTLNSDNRTQTERNRGINSAMQTINSSYDTMPKEILNAVELTEDKPWLPGKEAALSLLKKHPDLTAIIGGNGHIALGTLQAITETGKSVPEDISLIAMEIDLPAFEHTIPPLTAIEKPVEEIFGRAVELLIERINNPEKPIQNIQLAPALHERNSVKQIPSPRQSTAKASENDHRLREEKTDASGVKLL